MCEDQRKLQLADTAELLCDPTLASLHLRAMRLFEFQVSIFAPTDRDLQLDARVLAGMKILESLEEKRVGPFASRLELPGYPEVFEAILDTGGWRRIRYCWNSFDFDRVMAMRIREARHSALMADFSYRFAQTLPEDRRKGGPTMAQSVLQKANKKKAGFSTGTLRSRRAEYGPAAALQYLILIQKLDMRPPKLRKKKFLERLLSQAENIDQIRYFFAAYRDISKRLRPRGYESEVISPKSIGPIQTTLPARNFSDDELRIIKRYKS